jgi:hypothetical protein
MEAGRMLNAEPLIGRLHPLLQLRRFRVSFDRNAFGRFRAQMLKFAAAFGFENRSRQLAPDPHEAFFAFFRDDIMLLATNDTKEDDPSLGYSVTFHPSLERHAAPPPPENVDVLVEGLKKFIAPVEGAVMTEVTKP